MAKGRVIGLNGKEYKGEKPEPNLEVIKFLEDLLASAKEGNVQEVVGAYATLDQVFQFAIGEPDQEPRFMWGMLLDLADEYREEFRAAWAEMDE